MVKDQRTFKENLYHKKEKKQMRDVSQKRKKMYRNRKIIYSFLKKEKTMGHS